VYEVGAAMADKSRIIRCHRPAYFVADERKIEEDHKKSCSARWCSTQSHFMTSAVPLLLQRATFEVTLIGAHIDITKIFEITD
jgi:hypothetical protein